MTNIFKKEYYGYIYSRNRILVQVSHLITKGKMITFHRGSGKHHPIQFNVNNKKSHIPDRRHWDYFWYFDPKCKPSIFLRENISTISETLYKITDQYSSWYQGHEKKKKTFRNCRRLEEIRMNNNQMQHDIQDQILNSKNSVKQVKFK